MSKLISAGIFLILEYIVTVLFHLRNAILNRLIEILNLSGIRLILPYFDVLHRRISSTPVFRDLRILPAQVLRNWQEPY